MIRSKTALFAAVLLSCAAPNTQEMFTPVSLTAATASEVNSAFEALADSADKSLHVALPTLTDLDLAQAIVDAHERGVTTKVVIDSDARDTDGVALLQDAEVPLVLATDGIIYFDFNLSTDQIYPSTETHMAHAFMVADQFEFLDASEAGSDRDGTRVLITGSGWDPATDLILEHTQIFGGADATSTTAFDSLAKSIADLHWRYETDSELGMELWFGPQERPGKRIVDAIYRSRSSVKVLTNEFLNDSLIHALTEKADAGFEVEIIVGPRFGTTYPLTEGQINEGNELILNKINARLDGANARQIADADLIPTIVLIDVDGSADSTAYGFVQNADLLSLGRKGQQYNTNTRTVDVGRAVTEQFVDQALFVFSDNTQSEGLEPELQTLLDIYEDHRAQSEAL